MSLVTRRPQRARSSRPQPLTRTTQPGAAAALASACYGDAGLAWALGRADSARAFRVFDLLLGAVLAAAGGSSGKVEAATVGVDEMGSAVDRGFGGGVVLWSGPRSGKGLFEGGVAVRLALGLVSAVGFAGMRRILAMIEAAGRAGEAVEGGVCYQVWLVGVGEGRVGEGMGTRLMGGVLERCDAVGVKCCCVVFEGSGGAFLESLGFVERGKAVMPKGAPGAMLWVREPREMRGM